MRLALLACVLTLLAACGNDGPPEDYRVVVAGQASPAPDSCPDLAGTYALADVPLLATIAHNAPPPAHGLPVFMTFTRGASALEAWWVVPRRRVVAFAQDAAQESPKAYARWRSLVLKDHLPENLREQPGAYQAAVAELGPPAPTYANVVGSACRDGWMRAYSEIEPDPAAAAKGTPRDVEREIWLARDASGALLMRQVTYTLRHFTLWAASRRSIRTSHTTSYQKFPAADAEDAAPYTAAELPPDPATVPRPVMVCAEVPQRVADFQQRVRALLPPAAELTRYTLKPERQSTSDGHCPYAVVDVEIAGTDPRLMRVEDWLRREAAVDSVEILRLDPGQKPQATRRLRVVLH